MLSGVLTMGIEAIVPDHVTTVFHFWQNSSIHCIEGTILSVTTVLTITHLPGSLSHHPFSFPRLLSHWILLFRGIEVLYLPRLVMD